MRPNKPPKAEPPDEKEFAGLVHSGRARLKDAENKTLALESRFDLAYNAAHALCLGGYDGTDSVHLNGTSSSNYFHIHSDLDLKYGACSRSATPFEISVNMKAISISTRESSWT